ncbi:MAG TPA: hypothetical protein ENI15_01310 [Spirochaetes bacterium]|nr:hypothetical protein [Spirochaetota bacterium]
MRYTVADIKLIKKMVNYSNIDDEICLSKSLHKKQPHFCKIIDQVKIDSRCLEAHLFCTLFCSLAIDHAERVTEEDFPSFPEELFHDTAYMVAQKNPKIGKKALAYPDRIKRYILNSLDFDDADADWLKIMISAFLVTIENFSITDYFAR